MRAYFLCFCSLAVACFSLQSLAADAEPNENRPVVNKAIGDASEFNPFNQPEAKIVGVLKTNGDVATQFSPDGKLILTADSTSFRLWDREKFAPLTEPIEHGEKLKSADFAAAGKYVVTVGDKSVRVWDAQTGKPASPRIEHGKDLPLRQAALSGDGKHLFTIADEPRDPTPGIKDLGVNPKLPRGTEPERTVYVWDRVTGECVLSLKHERYVDCAAFSPDGSKLVTVCAWLNGTAQLWEVKSGKEIFCERQDVMRGWPAVAFSADGRRFVLAGWYRGTVHDGATGKQVAIVEDFEHEDLPEAVAISPAGDKIVVVAQMSGFRLWKLADTARPVVSLKHFYTEKLSITWSADGDQVFIPGSEDDHAGVWDVRQGKQRWEVPHHLQSVRGGRFEPDGTIWFFSDGRREVFVHRLQLPAGH
jgi:WD40 repeat protein